MPEVAGNSLTWSYALIMGLSLPSAWLGESLYRIHCLCAISEPGVLSSTIVPGITLFGRILNNAP